MRRYAFPLILFSAIAVVVVVYVNSGDDGPKGTRESGTDGGKRDDTVKSEEPGGKSLLDRGARNTPTPLHRHRWLSELERVLARDDLANAYSYRDKICQDIATIMADETLYRNLLATIKKYALDTNDLERRRLLIPLLRVMHNEEVTKIIEEEYYRALTEEERIFLLQAMADPNHSPQTAVPWVVDVAINSADENHRQLAYDAIASLQGNYDEVYDASRQILEASTRPQQRSRACESLARSAHESKDAQKYIRSRLGSNPREEEVLILLTSMDGWGSLEDAERIKSLAAEFPALSETILDHATRMRRHRLAEMGEDPFADVPPEERGAPRDEPRNPDEEAPPLPPKSGDGG